MDSTNSVGKSGEEIAMQFLVQKGYIIVGRNYRFGKGEIDIIAEDCDELVFVEVKYRKSDEYGHPVYAISTGKQKQLVKLAKSYLYVKNISNKIIRFDVVTIKKELETEIIEHIKDAFMEW